MIPALHIPAGATVRFPNGNTAEVRAKFGTGDGTTHFTFCRGDKMWNRRVPNSLRLEVV